VELNDHATLKAHLAAILEEMGVWTTRNSLGQGRPNILAFVGPTGVGKTTNLAKLAALQATRHDKRVALISIDNYGIAANEQLKTYARIIGLPLEAAPNAAELSRAIEKFAQTDLILIDTPGVSPSDPEQILELKSLLANIPNIQTHLVMCAATKETDLIATAEAFKDIDVQRLVFTKVDESRTCGNIIDVLIRTGLPLSFLSCGRRVPDDIEAGTVQKLIDLLLGLKGDGRLPSAEVSDANVNRPAVESGRKTKPIQFVANKNSDVYHCTDCKWSARIKAENIIQFSSNGEAEAQNFLPCRSCRPDRCKSGAAAEVTKNRLKFSGYS
jgi:flagellar biosynthesis protein FlhF